MASCGFGDTHVDKHIIWRRVSAVSAVVSFKIDCVCSTPYIELRLIAARDVPCRGGTIIALPCTGTVGCAALYFIIPLRTYILGVLEGAAVVALSDMSMY